MAWKITHDLLFDASEGGSDSYVGRGMGLKHLRNTERRLTFRLLDDDLEHYYTGVCDEAAWDDDDRPDGLYGVYQWAMNDSGCTHLLLKLDDLVRLAPHQADTYRKLAFETGPNKGWVSIFG
jgi:hypothetical protein